MIGPAFFLRKKRDEFEKGVGLHYFSIWGLILRRFGVISELSPLIVGERINVAPLIRAPFLARPLALGFCLLTSDF